MQDVIDNQNNSNRSSTEVSEKYLSDEDASKIMKNILQTVSYLHNLGIVHRDLKPENIMFQKANDMSSIKLIDFGLATQYNDANPLTLLDTQ